MELDNFKYNLSRLKKCDQYWDEMNPVLGGRLCSKCDKKIVDFSNMTFRDIAFFMSENIEPVCGFYRPDQLKQTSFSNSKLPIAISLTTLLTTSTISKAQKIDIQIEQNASQKKSIEHANFDNSNLNTTQKFDTVYLIGKVQYFDTTKQVNVPLSFATVIIKGSRIGTATSEDGNFNLKYLPTIDNDKISLIISSIGFTRKEIEVKFINQTQINIGIILVEKAELTEFWVTIKKRSKLKKFWLKITKPFRRH